MGYAGAERDFEEEEASIPGEQRLGRIFGHGAPEGRCPKSASRRGWQITKYRQKPLESLSRRRLAGWGGFETVSVRKNSAGHCGELRYLLQ